MKGTISKTFMTTTVEVTRYNDETKTEEKVVRKLETLRAPSSERIENWLMSEDRGYLSFTVLSCEDEVYTMSADEFIRHATRKEK